MAALQSENNSLVEANSKLVEDNGQLKVQNANQMQLLSDLSAEKTRAQKAHNALLELYKSLEARHSMAIEVSEARRYKLYELGDVQRKLAEEKAKSQMLEMQITSMDAQQTASMHIRDLMQANLNTQRDMAAIQLNKTRELEATVFQMEQASTQPIGQGEGPAKRGRLGE